MSNSSVNAVSYTHLLLLMLKQYNLFLESFQFACKNYKGNTNEADIAKAMGFESNDEYNEIMFLREITHTVNAFNDMADIVRLYSKKPEIDVYKRQIPIVSARRSTSDRMWLDIKIVVPSS